MNYITAYKDMLVFMPAIIVIIGSFIILLADAFGVFKEVNNNILGMFFVFCALVALIYGEGVSLDVYYLFNKTLRYDFFTHYCWGLLLLGAFAVLTFASNFLLDKEGILAKGELVSLLLLSLSGALIMVAASEMITFFIGLEIMSVALYAVCGSALYSEASAEASLKYFFIGAFFSAFLVFGLALLYLQTGSFYYNDLWRFFQRAELNTLSYIGIALISFAVLFKIGVVPFQFWVPDVYQGAPTFITAYMATVVKASIIAVALRFLWHVFPHSIFVSTLWLSAFLTVVFGNLVALRQRSAKRMLAYSSIAHGGYMLMGLLAYSLNYGGAGAVLYYIAIYMIATLGSFAVVLFIIKKDKEGQMDDDITLFNGLSANQPLLAGVMTIFLFSLAGLPPGFIGLLGKFYIFNAVVKSGYIGLAIVAIIGSLISCYYYLRVIVAMYFIPAIADNASVIKIGAVERFVLLLLALLSILLGIFPSYLYNLAERASLLL